ncbi:MAG: 50S ribosomal protein L33 [Candidatus Staskawiczbacteria bacterium RIFOXYD1_FULL_39_28]|uniref:Large ribosomal subunit protein bL33 n=1 Tax=Candidatus Staskawiczbacteria bacterium RIFOXYC1_FULL_38_18 TaxID=1802229 RepID=A0A1G2JEK1_9BACT|nr:MAG: 50S ribosomal protein L33 [Candidatus Staskawiczbacteria bacterium RIFOXYC1_FULL_38_18]OGZ90682.1 MAG: 50S ribosomal protein L33 [Candidatus Staskawiczbacteria bacterium RIFOXYD1_FULL_39_28]
MAVKKAFTKLVCSACKTTNYFIKKTKKSAETKLELSKFCSSCHKHLAHKESKR